MKLFSFAISLLFFVRPGEAKQKPLPEVGEEVKSNSCALLIFPETQPRFELDLAPDVEVALQPVAVTS
jgi:hypothetical protein